MESIELSIDHQMLCHVYGEHYKLAPVKVRHYVNMDIYEYVSIAHLCDYEGAEMGFKILEGLIERNPVGEEFLNTNVNHWDIQKVVDYLRECRVAVPFRHYSIQKMIDMKWIEY